MSALLTRFRPAPGTTSRLQADSGLLLVSRSDCRVFQLGRDAGRLFDALAAEGDPRDADDLCDMLGCGRNAESVERALASMEALGLVSRVGRAGPVSGPPRRSRIAFRPPLAVAVRLIDPSRLLAFLAPLAVLLRGRLGLCLGLAGLMAQVAFLCWAPPACVKDPFHAVLAASLVLGVAGLHELAHGLVMTRAGVSSRGIGFMFMGPVPLLYCDVSGSVALCRRAQVDVALAGVVMQAQVGALLLPMAAGANSLGVIRAFIAVNLMMMAGNAVPFLPLDGYIALRAGLGRPNLRTAAIAEFGRWVVRLVGRQGPGGERGSEPRWLAAFGGAAALAPVCLVGVAVWRSSELAGCAGGIGALAVAVVVWLVSRIAPNVARSARSQGSCTLLPGNRCVPRQGRTSYGEGLERPGGPDDWRTRADGGPDAQDGPLLREHWAASRA